MTIGREGRGQEILLKGMAHNLLPPPLVPSLLFFGNAGFTGHCSLRALHRAFQ